MTQLIPVDHDPFAQSGSQLIPVDYDPFSEQQPSAWQDFSSGASRGAANTAFGLSQLIPGGSQLMFGATPEEVSNQVRQLNDQRQGRGWAGFAGELIGDPKNWAVGLVPGGLAARAAGGAAYGAIDPSTETTTAGQLEDKAGNAAINAGLAAALPAIATGVPKTAANFIKGMGARTGDALDEAVSDTFDAARPLYKKSEDAGALFTNNSINDLGNKLDQVVPEQGTKATQNLYSKTLKAISDFTDDITNPQGQVSLQTLDRHRQILGNLAKDITNPNRAQEAEMARRSIDVIDEHVAGLQPSDIQNNSLDAVDALNAGRAQWAKAKRFEAVAKIIQKAGSDPQKLQNGFARFVNNKKNLIGFSDKEIATLKAASQNNLNEKIVSGLAKFGFNPEHIISSVMAPGLIAKFISEPLGAGLSMAGSVAKPFAKNIAKGKAEAALQMIERR